MNIYMPWLWISFRGLPGRRIGDTLVTFGIVLFGVTGTWATFGVEVFGGLPLRGTVGVAEDGPSKSLVICKFH